MFSVFTIIYLKILYGTPFQDERHVSFKIRVWSQQWNQLAYLNDFGVLLNVYRQAGIISHGYVANWKSKMAKTYIDGPNACKQRVWSRFADLNGLSIGFLRVLKYTGIIGYSYLALQHAFSLLSCTASVSSLRCRIAFRLSPVWCGVGPEWRPAFSFLWVFINNDPVQTTLFDEDTCLWVSCRNWTSESKSTTVCSRIHWL